MQRLPSLSAMVLIPVLALSTLHAQQPAPRPASPTAVQWPGPRPDGSVLLPDQWSLRPVGKQIEMGDFPVDIALSPDGRYAAILHCGYSRHQIWVVDVAGEQAVSHVDVPEAFYGLAFSPDGGHVACSGAGNEVVYLYDFEDGHLSHRQAIRLHPVSDWGVPSGLCFSQDGKALYVANLWGQSLDKVDLETKEVAWELSFLKRPMPAKRRLPASPKNPYLAAAAQRRSALKSLVTHGAPFPYDCVLDGPRHRLYVSLWNGAAVAVIDLKTHREVARWATEEHPNEMLMSHSGRYLYVANANRNTVSVLDLSNGRAIETLSASLYPKPLLGSTPNSLALSPDDKTLFVANACNNNVAVFDVSHPGKTRAMGFIPVGWYPTSVRVTLDGKKLLVANGKGLSSRANPNGPQPARRHRKGPVQYIGSLFTGSLSVIPLPGRDTFERELKGYTATAYQCCPLTAAHPATAERTPHNPIPAKAGDPSPIKYCLYVIKENRTYDQVFGDMKEGNGDPSLCLFPEHVTPNLHRLARQFVLLDSFYVNSEVSADGHEWSTAAYASDFVEKTWPLSYGHNRRGKFPYPSEGNFEIAYPSSGYLWDDARRSGVSYYSYGEFINPGAKVGEPGTSRVAGLQGHFDPYYRGWDLNYPDVKRVQRFVHDLKKYETEGTMPRLQILRLPNDHTYGTATGKLTPTALVADNDLAVGKLVEAVSHSKFWSQTAIFIVEDDAQNGPDHVDAHRTEALVISPWTKRHVVDSTMYSTCSMLHTIELILGLPPMTQFDASARPMYAAFQDEPDLAPYEAHPANVDLHERNRRMAWGRRDSDQMDFSKADDINDFLLNEIVWRSVKGAGRPMPAPRHAAFVFSHDDKDAD